MERLSIYFSPTEVFKVSSLKTARTELADQTFTVYGRTVMIKEQYRKLFIVRFLAIKSNLQDCHKYRYLSDVDFKQKVYFSSAFLVFNLPQCNSRQCLIIKNSEASGCV